MDTNSLITALQQPSGLIFNPSPTGSTGTATGATPLPPAPGTGTSISGPLPAGMGNNLIQALRRATPVGNMNKGISKIGLGRPNSTGKVNTPWTTGTPKFGESGTPPILVPIPNPNPGGPPIVVPIPGGGGGGTTPTNPVTPGGGGGGGGTTPDYNPGPQETDPTVVANRDPTEGLDPAAQGHSNGSPVIELVDPYSSWTVPTPGPVQLKPGETFEDGFIKSAPAPTSRDLTFQDIANSIQWDRAADPNGEAYMKAQIEALRAAGF